VILARRMQQQDKLITSCTHLFYALIRILLLKGSARRSFPNYASTQLEATDVDAGEDPQVVSALSNERFQVPLVQQFHYVSVMNEWA